MITFLYTKAFQESFDRLEKDVQNIVRQKLLFFSEQESPLEWSKKIRGFASIYRLRVGAYRILVERRGDTLVLLKIQHRSKVYRLWL